MLMLSNDNGNEEDGDDEYDETRTMTSTRIVITIAITIMTMIMVMIMTRIMTMITAIIFRVALLRKTKPIACPSQIFSPCEIYNRSRDVCAHINLRWPVEDPSVG